MIHKSIIIADLLIIPQTFLCVTHCMSHNSVPRPFRSFLVSSCTREIDLIADTHLFSHGAFPFRVSLVARPLLQIIRRLVSAYPQLRRDPSEEQQLPRYQFGSPAVPEKRLCNLILFPSEQGIRNRYFIITGSVRVPPKKQRLLMV